MERGRRLVRIGILLVQLPILLRFVPGDIDYPASRLGFPSTSGAVLLKPFEAVGELHPQPPCWRKACLV